MRRPLAVPLLSAAMVAGVVVSGVAAAGAAPRAGGDVAKTTIGPAPTQPTVPVPTAPVPTAPVPTAPVPTVPLPTVPLPTAPVPTAPVPTVPLPTGGVPTTEAAGLSQESLAIALPMFGLDLAKLQCVDAALPPLNNDDNLAVAALQGCGVALMPILRGIVAVSQQSNTFLDPTATTVVLPTVPGAVPLPPEDAFYLGFMLLMQPEQVSCLATGVTGATPDDDNTALAILDRCGVSLGFTLDMLTFALVGDLTIDPTATTIPAVTAPVPSVPPLAVPGAPTTSLSISPDDPLVDQFQEMLLEQQVITLDDQQAACLLSSIDAGTVDPNDTDALMAQMEACGILLTDLVPSGARHAAS